jgi:hypothetical protein
MKHLLLAFVLSWSSAVFAQSVVVSTNGAIDKCQLDASTTLTASGNDIVQQVTSNNFLATIGVAGPNGAIYTNSQLWLRSGADLTNQLTAAAMKQNPFNDGTFMFAVLLTIEQQINSNVTAATLTNSLVNIWKAGNH